VAILHREVEWLQGIDPRAPSDDRSEWVLGYVRGTDWNAPSDPGHSRYFPDVGIIARNFRPFLTKMSPFSADSAGVAFPAGQVFAVFDTGGAGRIAAGVFRSPGDTTNPITVDYPIIPAGADQSKRESWPVYRATCVPAGAHATIEYYDTFGTPTATTTIIPSATFTRNITQYLEPQTIDYDNDPTPYMVITWTGGFPITETVGTSILNNAIYVPVPTSLDAAYTARSAHDVERGGIFDLRQQADRRRVRAHPSPWGPAIPSGLAAAQQSEFWLSGVLKSNAWVPAGLNGQVYDITASIPAWPPAIPFGYPGPDPATSSVTTVGARAVTLDITCSGGGAESFLVKVKANGSYIHSASYSATSTGISIAPPALPAHGSTHVYELEVHTPSALVHWTNSIQARLRVSPRLDIPYPFALVGRDPDGTRLAAPGGYLPGQIADYVPAGAAVARLAAGVTTATVLSSFKPAADAWYQTKNGGVPVSGGSDDFGASDTKQIDRGRTNQPYYIGGAGDLSVYTPSPHSIASGGTDLTPTIGNWWEWGTVAFGGAGNWLVSILCKNVAMLKRGMVVEWSATESTVIHPGGQVIVETLDEGAGLTFVAGDITWAGSTNTPPGSPVVNAAYVVTATATGAWTGHEGEWAVWDDYQSAWLFFTPDRYSYLVNALGTDWTWFDGNAWKAKTDPILSIAVSTAGPTTWGLSLRQWSLERTITGSPTATVKWAAA
jgi:hypothetical protein